eukprot:TRINITY_DN6439_c0_g1_i2.p1 TRINITY_DN6439_c0_g1~~TRINITY_DN6439_c0_g1_i2.p1  ORF type:complete len:106 (+),score=15.48 TRINITY_DN6439_c0_g1_i2:602-919(+)
MAWMTGLSIIFHICNVTTVPIYMIVNSLVPSIRKLYMIVSMDISRTIILFFLTKVQILLAITDFVFKVVRTVFIVIMPMSPFIPCYLNSTEHQRYHKYLKLQCLV